MKVGGYKRVLLVGSLVTLLYFSLWPVPITPVAWQAPENKSFTGTFAPNDQLDAIQLLDIGHHHGPEDIALDNQGRIYTSTHSGWIVRLKADGSDAQNWVNTGGRPLGIEFDQQGNLIVADALQGLLSIDPLGEITALVREIDGQPLNYADDVDIAADGKIYFSDASSKFAAKRWGTLHASMLDILEHAGHGRLLVFDPTTNSVKVLLSNLNFANGVTISHDQRSVLVNETGRYRVMRYWLKGERRGQTEVLINNLPGFPDNISKAADGHYWLALFAPRNAVLDALSDKPFWRKVLLRLPAFLLPQTQAYGHIVMLDEKGNVLRSLQNPQGDYPKTTSVTQNQNTLYIGSLTAPNLARLTVQD